MSPPAKCAMASTAKCDRQGVGQRRGPHGSNQQREADHDAQVLRHRARSPGAKPYPPNPTVATVTTFTAIDSTGLSRGPARLAMLTFRP